MEKSPFVFLIFADTSKGFTKGGYQENPLARTAGMAREIARRISLKPEVSSVMIERKENSLAFEEYMKGELTYKSSTGIE